MAILDFNNEEEVKKYKEFVEQSEFGRFPQNTEWINVKRNWGHEAVYVEKNGKIVASMLILIKKILGFSLFYAQAGPVCDLEDIDLVKELILDVDKLAKKHKAFALIFDPDFKAEKEIRDKYVNEGFKVTKLGDSFKQESLIQPIYTCEKKLNFEDREELLSSYSSNTRHKLRYAKKKGAIIEYGQEKELIKRFFELHKATCHRKKIAYREYEYYENLINSFKEKARAYVVSFEGKDCFAGIAINSGAEVYYVYGGSSDEEYMKNTSQFGILEMMNWGIETNAEKINLGGFMHLDKTSGLYNFKIRLVGEEGIKRKLGQIEKIYNPFIYFMYEHVLPLRNKIKNFLSGSGLE